ncbi:MAG: hypothetical protein ACLU4P_03145 [Ruminococcus sp.]
MAKGINQKGKILYLEKILRETSETHPCTMQEIIGKLQENGVSAERKSIYDDMEVLRSFGMDIKFKRGKYTGYYVAGEAAAESVSAAITEKNGANPQNSAPNSVGAETEGSVFSSEAHKKAKNSWLLPPSDSEEDKPVRLFAETRKRRSYGSTWNYAQYSRRKEEDTVAAVVQIG